jgi:hypothetical protein
LRGFVDSARRCDGARSGLKSGNATPSQHLFRGLTTHELGKEFLFGGLGRSDGKMSFRCSRQNVKKLVRVRSRCSFSLGNKGFEW